MVDCAILGGGISGLTAAYYLKKAGHSVVILESSERLGGVIQSGEREGFLLEWGPNSTYAQEAVTKLSSQLGIEAEIVFLADRGKRKYLASTRGAGVLELVAVPDSLLKFILSPILSAPAKLRILGDLVSRRSSVDDESVERFMTRHFGEEVTERVIDAVLSGVWATDISRLSIRSSLPKIWLAGTEHGSVIRGLFKQRGGGKRPAMLTFQRGMGQLVEALRATFDSGEIVLDAHVSGIRPDGEGVDLAGETPGRDARKARSVIVTAPAKEVSFLLRDQAELSSHIRNVPYSPLGVLHLGYAKKQVTHSLDGFGFLCPPILSRGLLGAVFSSSLVPSRAPEGFHLLTCFCGGARFPHRADVTDSGVLRDSLRDLAPLIGSSGEPRVLSATYYPEAIPSYPVGHQSLVNKVRQFEQQHPQIKLLGNWLEGISVAERIKNARESAERISQFLQRRGSSLKSTPPDNTPG